MPKIECLSEAQSSRLLDILGLTGLAFSAITQGNQSGHYYVRSECGAHYYIKKVAAATESFITEVEQIKIYIARHYGNISKLLYMKRAIFEGEEVLLLVYTYYDGRQFSLCQNDILLLAKHVALLHNALNLLPNQQAIKIKTVARYQALDEVRTNLLRGAYKNCKYNINSRILALMKQYDFEYFITERSVPVHGDLNAGNFLIMSEADIYFFDFEDVVHSYQPVMLELAYIIERLILIRVDSDEKVLHWGKMFLSQYQCYVNHLSYNALDDNVLEILVLRALCTILLYMEHGTESSIEEWNKFIFLYDLATRKKKVIAQLLGEAIQ